jgi:hypothetical protein
MAKRSGSASGREKKSTHREYLVDRNDRLQSMVRDLEDSPEKKERFLADPLTVAKAYGVSLSKEEVFGIRFLNGISVASIVAGLRKPGVAFFDNNCGCGGGGGGPSCW